MTTTEKLTHLLKIEAEATKGPWKGESFVFVYGEGHSPVCHAKSSDDRNLIIASRNAIRPMVTALAAAIFDLERIQEMSGRPENPENPYCHKERLTLIDAISTAILARIGSILSEIP